MSSNETIISYLKEYITVPDDHKNTNYIAITSHAEDSSHKFTHLLVYEIVRDMHNYLNWKVECSPK